MFFLLIVYWNTIYLFHLPLLFPSQLKKKKKDIPFPAMRRNRNDEGRQAYLVSFPIPLAYSSEKPTFLFSSLPSVLYEHFICAHLPNWISIERPKLRQGNHL